MFQFTTTTVINNPVKDKAWTVTGTGDKEIFRVIDGPAFNKKVSAEIFVAPFQDEVADKVEIDLSTFTDGFYRLVMYIRSIGNADPTFANAFVFKGKPLHVEFKGGSTAEEVKKVMDKFLIALYGEKIVKVTAASNQLTLEGMNGYQRFHQVTVEKWVENANLMDGGSFEVVKDCTADVEMGCEGYGTYEQVLHDLRLPTGDNLSYMNANAMQMPVLGGEYTQVTVRMCADLENYPGGIGVHNPTKSITNHVLFVNGDASELISDLESVLGVTAEDVPAEESTDSPSTSSLESTDFNAGE